MSAAELRNQGSGAVTAVLDAIGGSGGGMGLILPLLLAATVLGAVAVAARRDASN